MNYCTAMLALVVSMAGCGQVVAETPLDPGVPPFTTGNYYRPAVTATWHWQLQGSINTSYDVDIYDIDLFDVSASLIAGLQADGRKVICYFSAGSAEDFRSDYDLFAPDDLGNTLDGFEDERYVDIRRPSVHQIMLSRLDLAVDKGCNGVEPDNVQTFDDDTGFALDATDQLAYNRFLANEAHARGLSVGLKNGTEQAAELVDYYDFELNEQCHQYDECDVFDVFLAQGKPILNAEYRDSAGAAQAQAVLCPQARAANLRTVILPVELDDSFRVSCDD